MWLVAGGKLNASIKSYADDLGFSNLKYVDGGVTEFVAFYSNQLDGIVVLDTVGHPFKAEEYQDYKGNIFLFTDKEEITPHQNEYTLKKAGELEGLDVMELLLNVEEGGLE